MIVVWIGIVAMGLRSGWFWIMCWDGMLQSEGKRGIKDELGFWPE